MVCKMRSFLNEMTARHLFQILVFRHKVDDSLLPRFQTQRIAARIISIRSIALISGMIALL